MRIAQVAPLYESVPPKYYGGTERVIHFLTEALIGMGHDVTLFATKDSNTSAMLIPICPQSLRLSKACKDPIAYHILMIEKVFKQVQDFDILHFHIDYLPFSMIRRNNKGAYCLSTMHGRLDIHELYPLFKEFYDIGLVSISNSQRKPMLWANWVGTVYHGLPEDLFVPYQKTGKYLAFLGRVSPEKGLFAAIEIAEKFGMLLKIAAKIDDNDRVYYEKEIKPLLNHHLIEYIGEIGETEKNEFLGNAYALLFPISWPEPFGLVMIEAMACGTPVIAFPFGSVPEIMKEGKTGYMVNNTDQAIKALEKLRGFNRRNCRRVFEEFYTSTRMACNYLDIYKGIKNNKKTLSVIRG